MKNGIYRSARPDAGFVLIACMILLLMLSLIGIMSISSSNTDMDIAANESKSSATLYLADAGLEKSIAVLSDSISWRRGFSDEVLGDGSFSVVLEDSTTQPFLGERLIVRSTGQIGAISKTVEAYIKPVYDQLFHYGAYGRDSVYFQGNGIMDSYDSDLGTYGSQRSGTHAGDNGTIGSQGGIILDGTTQIYGDAATSSPGDFTFGGGAVVHGDTTSSANPPNPGCIDQADLDYARANTNAPGGLIMSGRGANYNNGTHALDVAARSTVTFTSGIYYFSDVNISGNASIIIPDGENVVIYVSGIWDSAGGAIVNNNGIPSSFQVFVAGDSVAMAGGTDFYGTFYAPCSDVTITGGSDFYGAIVGQTFTNGGGTRMHYDEAATRDIRGAFLYFTKEAWTEL